VIAKIETKEFDKLSKSAQKCYKAAYKKYEIIHNKVFATLKICDMQNCIDDNESGYTSNRDMKNLASKLYQYSMVQKATAKCIKIVINETHYARGTAHLHYTNDNTYVNESVIKEIVGHKSAQSFTERVYTHIYLKAKIDAVNTIHT